MKLDQRMQRIKLILSDVDGVMTDGGIAFDNQGIEYKQFHVRDGLGIKLWQQCGFKFGIVTARSSHIVKVRASELGVDIVRQGFEFKLAIVEQLAAENDLELDEVCFIGDDLADLQSMMNVGLAASVADGAEDVKNVAHLVTTRQGGRGAVRELIETILKSQNRWQELIGTYKTK